MGWASKENRPQRMTQIATSSPVDEHARLVQLYEVSQILGSSLDLTVLLNRAMDAIIQLTGAERGFLMLDDPVTGGLELRAGRNVDRETVEREEMEVSRTVIRRVVESGDLVVTSNAQEDPRFSDQSSVIGYSLRSIMCAPLRASGKIIGAVYVDNRVRTGIFSTDDLGMLAAFANQAAIAIENARLFTLTDQALAARVEELSVMQRIDRELNESLDFSRVMDLTIEWAVKLAHADGGLLMLLEDGSEQARVVASRSADGAPDWVPLAHPVIKQVLARGETIVTTAPSISLSVDGSPAPAQMAVPVKREGDVIALISLECDTDNVFHKERVAFVERLADHAAIAIENARLYDAVTAANQAKSAFISVVTHELRLPMTSIRGYTDILKTEAVGPLNEMQREFLTTIRRNVDRMNVLVTDLSDINRIESGRLRLECGELNVVDVVNEAVDGLESVFQQKEQTISVQVPSDLPPAFADRGRVIQIATNLLSNASKYSPAGRKVTVTADQVTFEGRSFVRVSVVDQGIGISPEDQPQLFTQFFRSEDPAVRIEAGWGLGLSIVKMLTEVQGGQVALKSALGVGSTFAFTLPTAVDP